MKSSSDTSTPASLSVPTSDPNRRTTSFSTISSTARSQVSRRAAYESRTAEVRGKKEKKKLFENEAESEVVRLIFDLAERGFDGSPMGARAIAEHLNANGYTLRGRKFHNSNVADLLQRPHYLGRFPGSKVDELGNLLPEDEWIWVDCPRLISQEQFDRVAALRASRAPRVVPSPYFDVVIDGKIMDRAPAIASASAALAQGQMAQRAQRRVR